MSPIIERLLRVRTDLVSQIEEMETGQIKVLHLLDGGTSDEDCTRDQVAILWSYLNEVDTLIHDVSEVQGMAATPLTAGALPAGGFAQESLGERLRAG